MFGAFPFGTGYFGQGSLLARASVFGTAEPDVICYALPDVGIIRAPGDAALVGSARDARIRATTDAGVIDVMADGETIVP